MENEYFYIKKVTIEDICNALREVLGTTEKYSINEIADKIRSIHIEEE